MKIRRFRSLHAAGASYAENGRECGVDRRTVKKYLAEDSSSAPPTAPARVGTQPQVIAPFVALIVACPVDPETGELAPVVTIVTENGGPFRSFRFESFIAAHPELLHVRTRMKTPGQNGSRERGVGTLKYERLYLDEIDDALMLAERAEDYRIQYNELRPHEAISWNRPKQVHLGLTDPTIPTFKPRKTCQLLDAGHSPPSWQTHPSSGGDCVGHVPSFAGEYV